MNELDRLINAVRQGDPTAGALVVSIYGRRLMHYVRSITPTLSEVDCELLAERTIEAALANIDRYDEEISSFDTWVRGFVRLKLLEHYRGRLGMIEINDPDELHWSRVSQLTSGPSDDSDKLLSAVSAALRRLPATDQLIISLRDINGLPYQAIAEELNVSVVACRQRHKRAIETLRRELGDGPAQEVTWPEPGPGQTTTDPYSS
ncbi:sigma-70 family RNA polymerase sigma factor [uncultured Nocardioides sp.]|uniref:RNA polymerase sigma factor n=1 Tax=uncultured Nocardioides sp. TaxID=198441 RepID=UPI0026276918|nr:sigma-70 family RNA polymerase sigma factor [uncultured Nocardioides sp.]